jgi:hypothetical protein
LNSICNKGRAFRKRRTAKPAVARNLMVNEK